MRHLSCIFLIVLFSQCEQQKPKNYSKLYNDYPVETFVRIDISNLSDTIKIGVYSTPNLRIDRTKITSEILVKRSGQHLLRVLLDRPSRGYLHIDNENYSIALIPGDTIQVEYNHTNRSTNFVSTDKESNSINKYYSTKKAYFGYGDIRPLLNKKLNNSNNPIEFVSYMDSLMKEENYFLHDYLKKTKLPNWFQDFEKGEIKYRNLSVKTQLPHIDQTLKFFNADYPNEYFDFLDTININDHSSLLSSRYFWFLDNFFLRDLPLDSFNVHSGLKRSSIITNHIIRKSKSTLDPSIRSIYYKWLLSGIIVYYSEEDRIDSLANALLIEDHSSLLSLSKTRKKSKSSITINPGELLPTLILVNEVDSLITFSEVSQKLTYVNIWATWCGPCIQNFPKLNSVIESFEGNEIQFVNICLSSNKDYWKHLINKHNVRGVNLFAEGNWNKKVKDVFALNGFPHYAIIRNNRMIENNVEKDQSLKEKLLTLTLE